jgi:hypothetical protein
MQNASLICRWWTCIFASNSLSLLMGLFLVDARSGFAPT